MTKREAAIVSAYIGIMLGNFSEYHKYVEEVMNRPVHTIEFANKDFMKLLKEKSKKDFINIKVQ